MKDIVLIVRFVCEGSSISVATKCHFGPRCLSAILGPNLHDHRHHDNVAPRRPLRLLKGTAPSHPQPFHALTLAGNASPQTQSRPPSLHDNCPLALHHARPRPHPILLHNRLPRPKHRSHRPRSPPQWLRKHVCRNHLLCLCVSQQ